MIIRILSEGQFDVPADQIDALNALDDTVHTAVTSGDAASFGPALAALLDAVRAAGTALDAEEIVTSEAILPPADATLDEVRDLLHDDGLIPG